MKKTLNSLAILLIGAEVLLILVSWLLSATLTEPVRSLLSAEGLRWYVSNFSDMLMTPLLTWILLVSMSVGCVRESGICQQRFPIDNYRERLALLATSLLLILYIGVILWLTVVPHAILLSATGSLWPSPFSKALVPLLSFGVLLLSAVYGLVTNRFSSLGNVFISMVRGLSSGAPLLFLYVLFIQFYESLRFVFMYY